MKKGIFGIAFAAILFSASAVFAATPENIDMSTLGCDKTRGEVVEVSGLTFTAASDKENGIDTKNSTVDTVYISLDNGVGCYSLTPKTGRYFIGKNAFSLKPNRSYLISVLVNCKYDRNSCEVSLGFYEYDDGGNTVLRNYIGTPADTNGWYRFEGTVTTSSRTQSGKFSLSMYGFNIPDNENEFYISDLNILELPAVSLVQSTPGEGMVFGGSSGMYNMRVKSATAAADKITVTTTGGEYVFDKSDNSVTAYQLINGRRKLFEERLNKSLASLSIKSQTETEAVLTTGAGGVTFGVQMDSLMLIANHGTEDLTVDVTSATDGKWNRLSQGNLMVKDDTGGFTVNPYIPMGTGRLARYTASAEVDFDGVVNDTTFISKAKAPWSVGYTVSDGEMLGTSVFPAREYDWKASFDSTYVNYFSGGSTARYAEDVEKYGTDIGVLWDFTKRGWGMSYGGEYTPISESAYRANIEAAHSAGIEAAPYMSMYYWYNRNVDEYIAEVKRHRDTYGIDGVYTDGLPDKEWLAAYEGARKLRELFPDGALIFHTTGQDGNGGPPMAVPDISIPAIDAYATITLRGEGVAGDGLSWEYPKNITAGYNTSNAIGVMKGDAWTDNEQPVSQNTQNLINLLYNGRARIEERAEYMESYNKILKKLKLGYAFFGKNSDYYEHDYLPSVHGLTRGALNFQTENILDCEFSNAAQNARWSIFGTANVSFARLGSNDVLNITDSTLSDVGGAVYDFGEQIGLMNVRFRVKTTDGAGGEMYLTDTAGKKLCGIYVIDNELRCLDRKGGYKKIADTVANEQYTVEIKADCGAKRFSVYIDGEEAVKKAYFASDTGFPSKICLCSSSSAAGSVYYDDVSIDIGF